MKITSHQLTASTLPANEQALSSCQTALDLKDRGDYEGALKAMSPLWTRIGERPDIGGLHQSVAAEVLLSVGILR